MNASRTITINWAALLSFSLFWLWGVNAYPAGSKLNDLPINVGIVFLFCYFTYHRNSPGFHTVSYLRKDILALFSVLAAIAVIFTWRQLEQPLWGDQIYHANFAARQGQLTIFMIEQKAPSLWSFVKDMPASTIVRMVNIILVGILGFLFLVLPKLISSQRWQRYLLVILMLGALVSTRIILSGDRNIFSSVTGPYYLLNEYGSDPHPILRLLPLMLTSTVIGVTDLGYRIAAFSGYVLFLLFLFIKIQERAEWRVAIAATLAIGTLPILWHISYLVEQSIWSTLASSIVFIMLFSSDDLESIPLIPVMALVIIATLLRSPAFVAFMPVAIVIGLRIYKDTIKRVERAPVLIMAAALALIVLISVLRGSPATQTEGPLFKWLYAETNNIPGIAAVTVLGLAPFFFIGFAIRVTTRDDLVLFLATLSFFALCSLVYYAPVARFLWGVGRYQAEIYVPLITAGIVAYCVAFTKERKNQWLAVSPLIFLIIVNIYSLVTFSSKDFKPFTAAPPPGEVVKAEIEYPAREAFQFIREHKLERHTYYVGIYYGSFVSIVRGFSADEYLNFSRLNNRHRYGWSVDADALSADPEISSVMIEPEADAGMIHGLLERGWKGKYDIAHARSGRTLTVLTRDQI